ncbi:hypothetical protein LCGC14_0174580 [marine sediment metagenome]|uniref:Uncharacterized protein n=1 Tax=marine sediment metagenome TaxID=412755 RepID=A0A0F9UV16_9ZZZZ
MWYIFIILIKLILSLIITIWATMFVRGRELTETEIWIILIVFLWLYSMGVI